MTNNFSQLELLPNEILVYIFEYFNAQDLFQAFYNLNIRFNILLQSLNNLCLILLKSNPIETNDNHILFSHISTLIINDNIHINLNHFSNLRRLKLLKPTYNQLQQIKYNTLYYLEYLSIGYRNNHFSNLMTHICDKIFSDDFPNLKSCDLFEPRILTNIFCRKPQITLRILKVNVIRISSYQVILSSCPNLYFLQFTGIDSHEKNYRIQPHENLKRMIIKYLNFIEPLSDNGIDLYLSYVPNLEHLILHRNSSDDNIGKYLNYQWISFIIDCYLPYLRQFKCHFHIFQAERLIKNDKKNILSQLKSNFIKLHNNRYKSRFIYKLSPLPFWEV